MYGNQYPAYMSFNPQQNIERINSQIAELEKMKSQIPQQVQPQLPTSLTQNFQISPNNSTTIRYANSIEDVQKEFVVGDTAYFSKDLSVVWIKNAKGDIKSYEMQEIVEQDEKDLQIAYLTARLNDLEGMIKNEQSTTTINEPKVPTDTSTTSEQVGVTTKKDEPSSISRVSKSKGK